MATGLAFPTIFLLPAHFEADELPELEDQIPKLTYDINEASIILGKVAKKPRAVLELRSRKLVTEEIQSPPHGDGGAGRVGGNAEKVGDSVVQVVRLEWFTDSLAQGKVLPVGDYLVYQGRKKAPTSSQQVSNAEDILKRAREDDTSSRPLSQHQRPARVKRPHLAQESTSEHEKAMKVPPLPDYLHTEYACQRPTPFNTPNSAFVEQLKKMRNLRTLESDDVGVRAYSTSIAAVAAYPYLFSSVSGKANHPSLARHI